MIKRYALSAIFLVAFVLNAQAASFQSLFAPDADLWERWSASDETARQSIDHVAWSGFLTKYRSLGSDGVARVAYSSVTPQDRKSLDDYINGLTRIAISSYAREEQFAFWINLYNALTIKVVLDAYPVESIRDIDISPGLFASGPWDAELIIIENEPMTLNDIEHRILRPIWSDPRIHYVLNCASLGCPNLAATAFVASQSETMLDDAARTYVNSPRGAHIAEGDLIVSRIYDWFHEDFGADEEAIVAYLGQYAAADLAEALAAADGIDSYVYDWALNDAN